MSGRRHATDDGAGGVTTSDDPSTHWDVGPCATAATSTGVHTFTTETGLGVLSEG